MKIENNNISFQSKIKFVDYKTFKDMTSHLNPKKHEVGWPWTADTMKTGKNLYTTGIMDCIAVIIKYGNKIKLAHLATFKQEEAKKANQKGFNIENVKRRLLENVNLDSENLHAIILGGFQLNPLKKDNYIHLNKIINFFDSNQIPCTVFGARRDVHLFGKFSMFYSNKEDTLYISNNLADKSTKIRRKPEIDVKEDSIEYNIYQKEHDKLGVRYNRIRKNGSFIDFMRSQFRQVSVCGMDELI